MTRELGLVGFGGFGRFLARHLRPHFDLAVSSLGDITEEALREGVRAVPVPEAASRDIVILCVPLSAFADALTSIVPHVRPGALIADVCSVKTRPVELMLERLPESVEVLGTHPLFGPEGSRETIRGRSIVLCPARTQRMEQARRFLTEEVGLRVLVRTPEEHDREMAVVQGLSHFIAKGLDHLRLPQLEGTTAAYEHLLRVRDLLRHDSKEVFLSIERGNAHAPEMRRRFLKALARIETELA